MKRKFIPGSEWLYFKMYTGVKTADIILSESILPLTDWLLEKKYIKKWFFIRYNDPKPHLRVRFELTNPDDYNPVFSQINKFLEKYMTSGEISNLLIDTYNREIERYGEKTMEEAEFLFYKNSQLILQEYLDFDDEEKITISIFYIDQMLSRLNLSINDKLKWVEYSNIAFKKEFNADKKLNNQLDKKYREFKPKYLNFLQSDEFLEERKSVISNIEESNLALQNIINHYENQSLEISLQSFFHSIFHMNINRVFVSNQRLFEMLIYDYQFRYYKNVYYH
jgi:thiopeptide-type bacteriocin biosynthesis protein